MMETVRSWMWGLTAVLVAVGYASSQRAFFDGSAELYSAKFAQPAVGALCLAWLALAVVCALLPGSEGGER